MHKFKINAAALRDVLKATNGVVVRRTTYPILSSMNVAGSTFTVTDLDLQVRIAGATIEPLPVPVALHLETIERLIPLLGDGDIEFQITEDMAAMHVFDAEYQLSSFDGFTFPTMDFKNVAPQKVGNVGLREAIDAVYPAVSKEETRYYLNGVCFSKGSDGKPVAVATNGHLMLSKPIGFMPRRLEDKILPSKTARYMLGHKGEPDDIAVSGEKVRFNYPGIELTSKFIAGEFPDWRRIVPSHTKEYLSVKRVDLLVVLKRILAFKTSRSNGVKISKQEDGSLLLDGRDAEYRFSEKMSAVTIDKDFEYVGFNAKYLKVICDVFKSCETISFMWPKDSQYVYGHPVKIVGDNSDVVAVLMPMRV